MAQMELAEQVEMDQAETHLYNKKSDTLKIKTGTSSDSSEFPSFFSILYGNINPISTKITCKNVQGQIINKTIPKFITKSSLATLK